MCRQVLVSFPFLSRVRFYPLCLPARALLFVNRFSQTTDNTIQLWSTCPESSFLLLCLVYLSEGQRKISSCLFPHSGCHLNLSWTSICNRLLLSPPSVPFASTTAGSCECVTQDALFRTMEKQPWLSYSGQKVVSIMNISL